MLGDMYYKIKEMQDKECPIVEPIIEPVADNNLQFQLGKCYRHTTGLQIKIVAVAVTTIYGLCLVSEDIYGNLHPVGITPENTINFIEISEDEWLKNFIKRDNQL